MCTFIDKIKAENASRPLPKRLCERPLRQFMDGISSEHVSEAKEKRRGDLAVGSSNATLVRVINRPAGHKREYNSVRSN
jgi:hypothetical protein